MENSKMKSRLNFFKVRCFSCKKIQTQRAMTDLEFYYSDNSLWEKLYKSVDSGKFLKFCVILLIQLLSVHFL